MNLVCRLLYNVLLYNILTIRLWSDRKIEIERERGRMSEKSCYFGDEYFNGGSNDNEKNGEGINAYPGKKFNATEKITNKQTNALVVGYGHAHACV